MKVFEPPEWDLSKEYQKTMKLEAKRFGLKAFEPPKAEAFYDSVAMLDSKDREIEIRLFDYISAERQRCLKAVDDEPELPGEIPQSIKTTIQCFVFLDNWIGIEEIFRVIVQKTKKNIRKRIEAA